MTPCVQTGPCREWIWWCRPRLGKCHGTAAPWDPGDTKEENPRPATPLTSVVSDESGLPVRGLKRELTFWRFHSFCPSSLVTNPVLGVGLLIGHPSTAEFNQDPDWPIPRCGFEIKPTRAPIAATIPAPTLCNSTATQRVSWPPSSPPTSPSLPAPPWPASSPPRRPRFPVRSAAARHDRVSIFCCKLHPPKRTVGYRLKPSGPWWPVTRGNARVVDRLADLTPPSPFQTAVKRVQAVKAVSVKAVAR